MRLLICVSLCVAGCGTDALLQQVGTLENRDVDEASGLARSLRDRDLLWVINDDGPSLLHAISRRGKHRGQVKIDGAANEDWEDLAAFAHEGASYLVVADIGDNEARRPFVTLYVVAEPDPSEQRTALAWRVNFSYPDGPRDAESLAVDAGGEYFYVLSKRDVPAVLYSLPLKPGTDKTLVAARLGPLDSLPQPSERESNEAAKNGWAWQPTAMDFAANGRSAAILTYGAVYFFARDDALGWPEALQTAPLEVRLGSLMNAEAIALDEVGRAAFVTAEKRHAPLLRVDLSSAWLLHKNHTPDAR